jgi:subtilisin family serine protease
MPTQDIGAAQFVTANPKFDGRGVTIGILDSGITLDHPALQTTSTGERKIIDWVTYTDPFTDDDPTWINMSAQVSGARFTYNGVSYAAPFAGSFRIGLFNERDPRLGGEVGSDVNRDGNPSGSSGIFAVLWDTSTNRVWVDTNQNGSFADETAMSDYRINKDIGYFGSDNPATAVAERMPFVVQTDGKNKVVNIGIVSGQHGSHVRRPDERCGAWRQARVGTCLPVHRGLHVACLDRGHDLRRQTGERRRDQHVDRRTPCTQRRQQRAGRAL